MGLFIEEFHAYSYESTTRRLETVWKEYVGNNYDVSQTIAHHLKSFEPESANFHVLFKYSESSWPIIIRHIALIGLISIGCNLAASCIWGGCCSLYSLCVKKDDSAQIIDQSNVSPRDTNINSLSNTTKLDNEINVSQDKAKLYKPNTKSSKGKEHEN